MQTLVQIRTISLYSAVAVVYLIFAQHGNSVASVCVRHEADDDWPVLVLLKGPNADRVRRHILRRITMDERGQQP